MQAEPLITIAVGVAVAHLLIGTPFAWCYLNTVGRLPWVGPKLTTCYFCTAFWISLAYTFSDRFHPIPRALTLALICGATASLFSAVHHYLTGTWPVGSDDEGN